MISRPSFQIQDWRTEKWIQFLSLIITRNDAFCFITSQYIECVYKIKLDNNIEIKVEIESLLKCNNQKTMLLIMVATKSMYNYFDVLENASIWSINLNNKEIVAFGF